MRHTILATLPIALIVGCASQSPFDLSSLDGPNDPAPFVTQADPTSLPLALEEEPQAPQRTLHFTATAPEPPPLLAREWRERHTLAELVNDALTRNPTTRATWERARAAAAQINIEAAQTIPQVSITAGMMDQRVAYPLPNGFLVAQGPVSNVGINLSWLLVDFGRTEADVARAREMLADANHTYVRKVQELVYSVQAAYFKMDAATSLRDAARDDLENARVQMEMVEARLAAGLATLPQALESRRLFAASRYELERADADVYDAKAALSVAVGMPPERDLEIESLFGREMPREVLAGLDEVVNTALSRRPDLSAAVSRVRAAEASVKRAEAEFLPEVTAFANLVSYWWNQDTSQTDGGPDGVANGRPYGGTIGFQGSWLLLDGGWRESALTAARAERSAAEQELAQLQLTASGEVWASYFDVLAARRALEAADSLELAARSAYEAVREGFVHGLTTLPDLLASEAMLADSRDAVIRARAELLESSARLALASGA